MGGSAPSLRIDAQQSVGAEIRSRAWGLKNNHDNYGDIIKNQHQIHFVDCADAGELEAEFRRIV